MLFWIVQAKGLEVVEMLRSEPGFEGIYGTLVDLIDCPADYRVPVEVTAMDSLFNVVVRDDTVVRRLRHDSRPFRTN